MYVYTRLLNLSIQSPPLIPIASVAALSSKSQSHCAICQDDKRGNFCVIFNVCVVELHNAYILLAKVGQWSSPLSISARFETNEKKCSQSILSIDLLLEYIFPQLLLLLLPFLLLTPSLLGLLFGFDNQKTFLKATRQLPIVGNQTQ